MKKMTTSALIMVLILTGLGVSAGADPSTMATGKTVIRRMSMDRGMKTSFLIVSKNGTVIALDPYSVSKDIDPSGVDAVCVTHRHWDHTDDGFQAQVQRNGGRIFIAVAGTFKAGDALITGIPASHDEKPVSPAAPSDVFYVIEVDGLRIVHMGDVGQTQLTAEQLSALGKIDIAFMQLANSLSAMTVRNGKAFKLIRQLNPRVVIPTHGAADAIAKLGEIYGGVRTVEDAWAIDPTELPESGTMALDLR